MNCGETVYPNLPLACDAGCHAPIVPGQKAAIVQTKNFGHGTIICGLEHFDCYQRARTPSPRGVAGDYRRSLQDDWREGRS